MDIRLSVSCQFSPTPHLPPWNPSMPPLLVIRGILFILISCLHPVLSENITAASSICPVPLSPLLQQLSTGINQYPICSLSSRPADPPPEFLSFEEWKAKQLAEQDASNREKESHSTSIASPIQTQNPQSSNEIARKSKRRNTTDQDATLGENVVPSTSEKQREVGAASSPRSHIPLIDRFNYASNECNARIHSSHKTAKSASSILSRKKDRYMLSPCQTSKESQFVIVELCEDIRIDTIQLANFEFFSGVFKDFRVSVAHAYTSDGKGWVVVGDYTAKNIRGVQSFHPSKELLPFYRYIRVDFLSYYGKEHFCPVSLLRVYGLTQMEEWKSDVWKAEWEASQTTAEPISSPDATVILLEGRPASSVRDSASVLNITEAWSGVTSDDSSTIIEDHQAQNKAENQPPESIATLTTVPEISLPGITSPPINVTPERSHEVPPAQIITTHGSDHPKDSTGSTTRSDNVAEELVPAAEAEFIRSPQSTEVDQSTTPTVGSQAQITSLKIPITTITSTVSSPSVPSPSISSSHSNAGASDISQHHTITRTVSTTIILSAATPSASPPVPNGESVYRMIINRLTTLEGNQTLYARYVEEQGRMVNVRLERMEEDIGRLGGIVTLQQQHVAKMLETHRAEMVSEHGKLVSQVEHLAHEVLMEKRLGVAQLLLLVTVLVFMGLTRGSRGEPIRLSRASAAWHKGIQSSGEWVSGWRGTRVSGGDEATSVMMHKTTSSPTLQLRAPYPRRSSSTRLDSIERRPRRTSSQRARPQETSYDEMFQTSSRLSRDPLRSRRNSQRSRSRNHTPTRPPLQLPDGTPGLGVAKPQPLAALNTNLATAGSGPMYQKGHKRTNSGGTGGYWRAGRSVSLTNTKTTGTGLSVGKSVGPTRRLAKTAHMHEVKPIRSASHGNGTDSSSVPERRRATADELNTSHGQSLSVLSPMMEDPHSAGMVGFGDAVPRGKGSGPVRIGGFEPEISTTQSEGVLSDPFGSGFIATSSSGLDVNSTRSSGLGIPFPSPSLDYEGEGEGEEDVWVDEGGDEEIFPGERSALGLALPSSSPTRAKRGSGFSFGSPRKFLFASSPPGKVRVKRRSDTGASAAPTARPDSQLGDGTPNASSTRVG